MRTTAILAMACLVSQLPAQDAPAPSDKKVKYSPYLDQTHPNRVFWGDTHLHTSYSTDAGMVGNTLGPEEALRFARGEQVISSSGMPARLIRPLDFLVVADHAENLGLSPMIAESNPELLKDPMGKQYHDLVKSGKGWDAYQIWKQSGATKKDSMPNPALQRTAWERIIDAVDAANKPGVFTAFHGFEWTSSPKLVNLHRNVIFRDGAKEARQVLPLTAFDTEDPEALWDYMEAYEKKTGGRALAGCTLGPEHAYRFAMGETVTSSTGVPARLNRPLGFQIGKVTKLGNLPVRFSVNPQYNLIDRDGLNRWGVAFTFTALFPSFGLFMNYRTICICGCVMALIFSTFAEEGGSGHYLPGSMASFVDGVPPAETFIARYNLVYYHGGIAANEPLPIAGVQTVGAEATSWAHGLSLLWRPPIDLGERWSYAFSATIPFVWMDVSANVTAGGLTGRRSSQVNGLGDIVLMPLMLNYIVSSNLNVNFRPGLYAPTGDYEVGRLANAGKNYWTVEPTVGLIYLGQQNGREASIFLGTDFNTENPDTNYKTGTQLHLDTTLAQHLPLFGGLAGVGVNGYWYEQVTGDSGSGASFGDFKGRTAGLGPVASFVFKVGSVDMIAEAKWLHEIETKNRLEGDIVWFKLVAKF